jgi:hypothetical protein
MKTASGRGLSIAALIVAGESVFPVEFANENADAAFKLAKDVAQAKDLHELIDLQTRYVQSQMKWYAG